MVSAHSGGPCFSSGGCGRKHAMMAESEEA